MFTQVDVWFDTITFVSYMAIALELLAVTINLNVLGGVLRAKNPRKRKLLVMILAIVLLFAIFICVCGLTHFLHAMHHRKDNHPAALLSVSQTVMSGACAFVSLLTAVVGLYIFPAMVAAMSKFEVNDEGELKHLGEYLIDTLELFRESIIVLDPSGKRVKRGNGASSKYFGPRFLTSSIAMRMHPDDVPVFEEAIACVSVGRESRMSRSISNSASVARSKSKSLNVISDVEKEEAKITRDTQCGIVVEYRVRSEQNPFEYLWVESTIRSGGLGSPSRARSLAAQPAENAAEPQNEFRKDGNSGNGKENEERASSRAGKRSHLSAGVDLGVDHDGNADDYPDTEDDDAEEDVEDELYVDVEAGRLSAGLRTGRGMARGEDRCLTLKRAGSGSSRERRFGLNVCSGDGCRRPWYGSTPGCSSRSEQPEYFRPSDIVMITRDISERKAEEALQAVLQAAREKELVHEAKLRYISTVAHDLKTPLQSITFAFEVLKSAQVSVEQREVLDDAEVAGELMKLTIMHTIDIEKMLSGGKLSPKLGLVHLPSLLERVDLLVRGFGAQVPIFYDVSSAAAEAQTFRCDEEWLWQMLLSLLTNACKFTEEGEIRLLVSIELPCSGSAANQPREASAGVSAGAAGVSVGPLRAGARAGAGGQWRASNLICRDAACDSVEQERSQPSGQPMLLFEVADTGVGVSDSDIPTLFEAFRDVPEGARLTQGTGLGLFGVRGRVEALGGSCGMRKNDSTSHSGSVFWFRVPFIVDYSFHGDFSAGSRCSSDYGPSGDGIGDRLGNWAFSGVSSYSSVQLRDGGLDDGCSAGSSLRESEEKGSIFPPHSLSGVGGGSGAGGGHRIPQNYPHDYPPSSRSSLDPYSASMSASYSINEHSLHSSRTSPSIYSRKVLGVMGAEEACMSVEKGDNVGISFTAGVGTAGSADVETGFKLKGMHEGPPGMGSGMRWPQLQQQHQQQQQQDVVFSIRSPYVRPPNRESEDVSPPSLALHPTASTTSPSAFFAGNHSSALSHTNTIAAAAASHTQLQHLSSPFCAPAWYQQDQQQQQQPQQQDQLADPRSTREVGVGEERERDSVGERDHRSGGDSCSKGSKISTISKKSKDSRESRESREKGVGIGGGLSAIVVDDVRMIQKVMERILRAMGFESVECYPNGQRGLDALREKQVDIVFSDVQMPILSGTEMASIFRDFEEQELRAGRRSRRQLMVAVTANGMEFVDDLVAPHLFDCMLAKPARAKDISGLVRNLRGMSPLPAVSGGGGSSRAGSPRSTISESSRTYGFDGVRASTGAEAGPGDMDAARVAAEMSGRNEHAIAALTDIA